MKDEAYLLSKLFNLCARVFVRRDSLISALFYPAQIVYNGRELP